MTGPEHCLGHGRESSPVVRLFMTSHLKLLCEYKRKIIKKKIVRLQFGFARRGVDTEWCLKCESFDSEVVSFTLLKKECTEKEIAAVILTV